MNKIIIIIFSFMIFISSCNEHPAIEGARKYKAELSKNYPITLSSIRIYEERGDYYIEFSGTITNRTEHFLDELLFYPSIYYKKSTGDSGYVKFDGISIVSYGQTLESNKSLSFSKKCRFKEFNSDNLKYKFDEVSFEISLKGKNSTGYVLGENYTVNGMTWHPAKSVIITNEWKKIIK